MSSASDSERFVFSWDDEDQQEFDEQTAVQKVMDELHADLSSLKKELQAMPPVAGVESESGNSNCADPHCLRRARVIHEIAATERQLRRFTRHLAL